MQEDHLEIYCLAQVKIIESFNRPGYQEVYQTLRRLYGIASLPSRKILKFPAPFQVLANHPGIDVVTHSVTQKKNSYGDIAYEIRDETWSLQSDPDHPVSMQASYTLDGSWIGDPKEAFFLCVTKGILPEISQPDHSVCSIGYCPREKKFYGWSHRAMCGFGIGDMIYEGDYAPQGDHTPFTRHGRKKIKSIEDAKLAAINFAESVS